MYGHLRIKELTVNTLFYCINILASVTESVYRIYVRCCDAGILKSDLNGLFKTLFCSCDLTILGDGMSHTIACYLRILLCAPCICALRTLKYNSGTSVGHCHTGLSVELCTSVCNQAKLTIKLFHNSTVLVGTCSQHKLCMILADLIVCIAQTAHTGLRTIGYSDIDTAHICLDGKISACGIVYGVGEVKCRTALGAVLNNILLELIYSGKRTVVGTDDHTEILCLVIGDLYLCALEGFKT